MADITVAKIVTERSFDVKHAPREVPQVAMDSVSCPRAMTDVNGRMEFAFINGRAYKLREATFKEVVSCVRGDDLPSALNMFQPEEEMRDEG